MNCLGNLELHGCSALTSESLLFYSCDNALDVAQICDELPHTQRFCLVVNNHR